MTLLRDWEYSARARMALRRTVPGRRPRSHLREIATARREVERALDDQDPVLDARPPQLWKLAFLFITYVALLVLLVVAGASWGLALMSMGGLALVSLLVAARRDRSLTPMDPSE